MTNDDKTIPLSDDYYTKREIDSRIINAVDTRLTTIFDAETVTTIANAVNGINTDINTINTTINTINTNINNINNNKADKTSVTNINNNIEVLNTNINSIQSSINCFKNKLSNDNHDQPHVEFNQYWDSWSWICSRSRLIIIGIQALVNVPDGYVLNANKDNRFDLFTLGGWRPPFNDIKNAIKVSIPGEGEIVGTIEISGQQNSTVSLFLPRTQLPKNTGIWGMIIYPYDKEGQGKICP